MKLHLGKKWSCLRKSESSGAIISACSCVLGSHEKDRNVSRVGRAVTKEGEEARRDFRWIKEFLTVKDGLFVDVSQTPPSLNLRGTVQSGDPREQRGTGALKGDGGGGTFGLKPVDAFPLF